MTAQYTNFKEYLTLQQCIINNSEEDFIKTKIIKFTCKHGHYHEIKNTSFTNKKCKVDNICHICTNQPLTQEKFKTLKTKILELNGHNMLSFINTHTLEYECGNCGFLHKTTYANLKRQSECCSKCSNDKNRLKYQDIVNVVERMGMTLVTRDTEYKNNKQLLDILCVCGNPYKMTLSDIKEGKQCWDCGDRKRRETNLERYGVVNVSQNENIKEKIKEKFMEKYGVKHPMMLEKIREKSETTCLEKYGKKWAFSQEWVYEKIRKHHLEIYGVEFALQRKDLQEKISEIFMEKYNARRPFLSTEFMEKLKGMMRERYGVDWFVESKECKKIMFEKYGAEYFFQSKKFKEVMLEKYGVENALQCPKLFHKMIKSSFSKKEYVFKISGRKVNVMGYEHIAIDYLLSKPNSYLKKLPKEDEIIVGEEIPIFTYIDDIKKGHVYYPDIQVKNTDLIIEVKSVYTFNRSPRINYLKFKEVAKQGYTLQVLIYSSHKKLYDVFWFIPGKVPFSVRGRQQQKEIRLDEPYIFEKDEIDITEEDIEDYSLDRFQEEIQIMLEEDIKE